MDLFEFDQCLQAALRDMPSAFRRRLLHVLMLDDDERARAIGEPSQVPLERFGIRDGQPAILLGPELRVVEAPAGIAQGGWLIVADVQQPVAAALGAAGRGGHGVTVSAG